MSELHESKESWALYMRNYWRTHPTQYRKHKRLMRSYSKKRWRDILNDPIKHDRFKAENRVKYRMKVGGSI
jgi:hypothetical protein